MANTRVVQKNFWNCPRIAKYRIKSRYFLIGLASVAEDYGRFWYNVRNIKSQIYPTDSTSLKWIGEQLKIFIQDGVLCEYEANGQKYLHFIDWFDKRFALKQRLKYPKPDQLPDCKIHCMQEQKTVKKRQNSETIQSNLQVESNLSLSDISESEVKYWTKDYKLDTTGNGYVGYCFKCSNSDTYDRFLYNQDSRCCKAKILPSADLCEQLNVDELE